MAEVSKACLLTAENMRKLMSKLSVTSEIEWDSILKELQTVTELLKDELKREQMPETLYTDVLQVLRIGHKNLQENSVCYLPLTESYRTLRNACAACPRNQKLIYREDGILATTLLLCRLLLSHKSIDGVAVLCCAVQFLGNFSVGNPDCQREVWRLFTGVFSDLLSVDQKKLPHYTCMVIHTCLSGLSQNEDDVAMVTQFFSTNENGKNLVLNILDSFSHNNSEWMLYVLEDVLKLNVIWKVLGSVLNNQQKQLFLEIAGKQLSDVDGHAGDAPVPVSCDYLESIADDFITSAHTMLNVDDDTDSQVVGLVIMKELEVLCYGTSDPSKYHQLRTNQMLLRTSISLLHSVTALGKTGENVFSSKRKPSSSQSIDDHHPVFGLKRDLIRLIGNFSYRNTANQNFVRELDGLPLILDHTAIDERNPFITQWSVFAMRNLCEKNPENQAVLADLKMEGLADNVDMLRDFGVQAELKDDKIVVKPTSKP